MLTTRLPDWFGREASNKHYAQEAERLDGWAVPDTGLLLLKRHSPASAEIYWMGVDPIRHRQGVGRALVEAVQSQLRSEGVKSLVVKTLHPDVDYEPYLRTRRFYEGMGFALALSSEHGLSEPSPSGDPLAWYLKVL